MEVAYIEYLIRLTQNMLQENPDFVVIYLPMLILFELPLMFIVFSGISCWFQRNKLSGPLRITPSVSCIITCYGEGDSIKQTILTLCEQIYPGTIEIIPVIDGAKQNADTYQAAKDCLSLVNKYHNRTIKIMPKWQRGGRVSTLNTGLYAATGEIVINADGDTSFDNNMVMK